MVENLGIELIQMMENAGRTLAQLATNRFLDGDPRGKRVAVMAGPGGNGGALVCARRLLVWGAHVRVFTSRPGERFAPVSAQLRVGDALLQGGNNRRPPSWGAGSSIDILNHMFYAIVTGATHSLMDR